MGRASRTTTINIFKLRHENRSVFVAACLCLTESRSHGNAKMNALIKKLEEASMFEGEVALTADDCDYDHKCYDHCCPHKADVDGARFICCDPKWYPTVCATSKEACMS